MVIVVGLVVPDASPLQPVKSQVSRGWAVSSTVAPSEKRPPAGWTRPGERSFGLEPQQLRVPRQPRVILDVNGDDIHAGLRATRGAAVAVAFARPFLKAHNAQALILGIIAVITSSFCVGILVWFYMIYLGVQAYNGKLVEVPVITNLCKNQGWA